jgi:hypothetical protein
MRTMRSLAAALAVSSLLAWAGAASVAAADVDPSTLTPPPPPGSTCHTTGPDRVVCDTILNADLVNVPDFELPCGTLYLTGTDYREGFRFYEDGLMVRRHVTVDFRVTGSLSPTGEGPTIRLLAHLNWWSVWPIPGGGDDDALVTETGMSLKAVAPGLGADFLIAGRFLPDGEHTGRFTAFSEESMVALCEALDA